MSAGAAIVQIDALGGVDRVSAGSDEEGDLKSKLSLAESRLGSVSRQQQDSDVSSTDD